MSGEQAALEAHRFDWVHSLESVWHESALHVEALHADERARILKSFKEAEDALSATPAGVSPPGVFLVGAKGLGKTHLLGAVRREVWKRGGYFFLVELLDGQSFWPCVVSALLDGLMRALPDGRRQIDVWAERLAGRFGFAPDTGQYGFLAGPHFRPELVSTLISRFRANRLNGLRMPSGQKGFDIEDVLRALILLKSDHPQASVGELFLLGPSIEDEQRQALGFTRPALKGQACVSALSWLLGLTGASLIAFDQLDVLLDTLAVAGQPNQLPQIAHGLMDMKEHTTATLTLVSCFPETMSYIEKETVGAFRDRFRAAPVTLVRRIEGPMAREIVARRLAPGNARAGFVPPYPTWPVAESAFSAPSLPDFTPRELITAVAAHVTRCVDRGAAVDLDAFGAGSMPVPPTPPAADVTVLDRMFAELCARPVARPAPVEEDVLMPDLLRAGLEAWINERSDEGRYTFEADFGRVKPALHARLRRSLNEGSEAEEIWGFRAIGAANSNSVIASLRRAGQATGAGLLKGLRHLIILRSTNWPKGRVTAEAVAALERDGGRVLALSDDDLCRLAALREMIRAQPAGLVGWLCARRPTRDIALFAQCLPNGAPDAGAPHGGTGHPQRQDLPPTHPPAPVEASPRPKAGAGRAAVTEAAGTTDVDRPPADADDPAAIPIGYHGRPDEAGAPVTLPVARLRQHVAVFAGSGSGKTVLLRRLIEEAALRGISSIVLDTNNDLARLGEAWPTPPRGWAPGDAARARRLFDTTEVVIWTPGRPDGRALNLRPLPDFSAIVGEPVELREAVEMATATLAPLAKCEGTTQAAQRARAILKSAIEAFAHAGGGELSAFIALLADLPETLSEIRNAPTIAAGLADNLLAQCKLNVLLRDEGEPLDPGLLLTPRAGKAARISVISFVGLPDQEVKQSFVNQLQMALFAWLKKNPAKNDLGGLYVMDEAQNFAPSETATPCRQSTISLVSQARKYGLGMIFATQAPKGIHNRVSGNCTTQFFGRLNHPTQIAAAKELAAARGGQVDDISTLSAGAFYASSDGLAVALLKMPNCLSHHPASPPSDDEVLERARARDRALASA